MPDADTTGSGSKAPSPTDPSRSQIDFQFLNFSHPSEQRLSRSRKAVRSHVTTKQHRDQRAAAGRTQSMPQQAESDTEESAPRPGPSRTFPPSRPTTREMPGGSSSGLTSSPEASLSPSPVQSPTYTPARRLNAGEIYPESWQPYIAQVMVKSLR